jgi:PIN domain nuclease of toxin-antitoxin system
VKLLLDTRLLLLAAGAPEQLPTEVQWFLGAAPNELLFSSVSFWEITAKQALRRKDFQVDPRLLYRGLLDNGYRELPIESRHAIAAHDLPPIHDNAFDRILIAQALVEGIVLLTSDPVVARYPGSIRKV